MMNAEHPTSNTEVGSRVRPGPLGRSALDVGCSAFVSSASAEAQGDDRSPALTWTGVPAAATLENGAKQGTNDFRKLGCGGPMPPPGGAHRYYFTLYALDAPTGLRPGATKKDLLKAMQGHILAQGQLMGTYKRT